MGLILNGTVGNETFTDKQISATELIKLFKLEDTMKRLDRTLVFQVVDRKVKKKDGQTQFPERTAIMCTTHGTIEGERFELSYFRQRTRKQNKSGIQVYDLLPRKIYIEGFSLPVNSKQDLELAVFLFLHSSNETSPTREVSSRSNFKLHDAAAMSDKVMRDSRMTFEITNKILNDDINVLRLKAQGLRLGNFTDKSEMDVRSALLNKFNEERMKGKLAKFIDEFNAPTSQFTGMLLEAISRAIIVSRADKGYFVYQWGSKAKEAGKTICKVAKGEQPLEYLIRFATNNYEVFLKSIEAEIESDLSRHGLSQNNERMDGLAKALSEGPFNFAEKVSPLEGSVKDATVEEIVEASLYYELIEFNRKETAVYAVKGGECEEAPILVVKDKKEWKSELVAFYHVDADAIKTLRSRLHAKLNLKAPSNKNLMKAGE